MPELPFPPDLDQLRRQAGELLRAAAHGEPAALARLRAASDRVTLSAAQLAVAREHGFVTHIMPRTERLSWPRSVMKLRCAAAIRIRRDGRLRS